MDSWLYFDICQTGNSHIARGRGCEDYSISGKKENCVYAIVCDGHGGDRHFRSEHGSKICASVIEQAICELAENNKLENLLENTKKKLEGLVDNIIYSWGKKVDEDTKKRPWPPQNEARWEMVTPDDKEAFKSHLNLYKYIAYGTTFKFACVIEGKFWFCIQLGDGTICYHRNDNYEIADNLLSEDLKDRASSSKITASICDSYANRYVLYDWGTEENMPDMILCMTDGVDDAKAMNVISVEDKLRGDEKYSDFLQDKTHNYFSFVREKILKNISPLKRDDAIEVERLKNEIKTLCEEDFHYHDDISISGLIKKDFYKELIKKDFYK